LYSTPNRSRRKRADPELEPLPLVEDILISESSERRTTIHETEMSAAATGHFTLTEYRLDNAEGA
jgi:hypothetical protein